MLESEKKLQQLTDEQRIERLEKQVKRLEIIGILRATVIVLGVLGLTAVISDKISSLKSKIKI